MAFKNTVAYSSENPPDKKLMVGRADGMVLRRVLTVFHATSAGSGFGPSNPGVTMFGLSMHPSHKIMLSCKAFTTAACTLSVTAAHTSISWVPSAKISGSTIGHNPLAWEIEAYLAKFHAFSSIDNWVGSPLATSILYTFLHFENLAPALYHS